MKRFLCVSVFIFTALVAVIALSPSVAFAANYNAIILPSDSVDTMAYYIQDAINKAAYGDTVTVSGGNYDANKTLTLTIPYGRTVIWRADYIYYGTMYTSAIKLYGYGAFVVAESGFIAAAGTYCHAIDSYVDVVVSGGEVQTTGFDSISILCSGNVTVNRGIVSAFGAYGIAVFCDGDVTVYSGTIEATGTNGVAIDANGLIYLSGSAYITGDIIGYLDYPHETDSSEGGCNAGLGLFSLGLLLPLVLKRRSI